MAIKDYTVGSVDEALDTMTDSNWINLPLETQELYTDYIELRQEGYPESQALIAIRERQTYQREEEAQLLARSKETGHERRTRQAKENIENEAQIQADRRSQQKAIKQEIGRAAREAKQAAAKRVLTASKEAPLGASYETVGYTDPGRSGKPLEWYEEYGTGLGASPFFNLQGEPAGRSGLALPVQTPAPLEEEVWTEEDLVTEYIDPEGQDPDEDIISLMPLGMAQGTRGGTLTGFGGKGTGKKG